MENKPIRPQEAIQAPEMAKTTEECIDIPKTENGYYRPEHEGWSNK